MCRTTIANSSARLPLSSDHTYMIELHFLSSFGWFTELRLVYRLQSFNIFASFVTQGCRQVQILGSVMYADDYVLLQFRSLLLEVSS